MDLLDRLIGHDRWTTERLLGYCRVMSPEEWDRNFRIGNGSLRATFEHVLLARKSWVDLMTGTPGTWMQDEPLPPQPYDELIERNRASSERLDVFARDMTAQGRLDDLFTDTWGVEHSFGATILQVILHAHAHRAEILAMLEASGIENLPDGDPQEWEWIMRLQGS